ncbi:MAG: HmuY family protein [Bacteroidales bacterium]|nr:HmuY family protein [Bacteroidales bacterium]
MRNLIFISMLAVTLTSCFEEDTMVAPHQQGDLEVGEAALGPNYARQIFYDLNRNMEVTSNVLSNWDLSFESSTGGWLIRLNSSKFMYGGNSNDTTFAAEINESGLEMRFDPSDGNPDSTAIGAWFEDSGDSIWSLGYVYLVDRGMDEKNRQVGSKKVRFETYGDNYLVRFANNDNSGDTTVLISRDPEMDRIYFSFENGIEDIAPEPDGWSLLFSKYTTMLVTDEGDNYPYLVTGVVLNPNGVAAALDTIHDFTSIELGDTIDLQLSTHADVIGYDWKYYNFDDGAYTIVPGQAYLIRDRDGFYYKLRFIDFYNDTGEKGYPKFEYIRL